MIISSRSQLCISRLSIHPKRQWTAGRLHCGCKLFTSPCSWRLNQPAINRRFAVLKSRWIISVTSYFECLLEVENVGTSDTAGYCRLLNMPERLPTAYNIIIGLWVFLTTGLPYWNDKYFSEWKSSTRRRRHVTKGRGQRVRIEPELSGVWTPLFNRPGCHAVC